jgi:hypothetical protein
MVGPKTTAKLQLSYRCANVGLSHAISILLFGSAMKEPIDAWQAVKEASGRMLPCSLVDRTMIIIEKGKYAQ